MTYLKHGKTCDGDLTVSSNAPANHVLSQSAFGVPCFAALVLPLPQRIVTCGRHADAVLILVPPEGPVSLSEESGQCRNPESGGNVRNGFKIQ